MLYRSTARLSRCGAPMKNLAHSASFHSSVKSAPSKPGIKQDRRLLDRGDERYVGLRTRIEVLERDRDRLTRVEEKIGFNRDTLQEVSVKLDRKATGRP
jgi:hypothetical protein